MPFPTRVILGVLKHYLPFVQSTIEGGVEGLRSNVNDQVLPHSVICCSTYQYCFNNTKINHLPNKLSLEFQFSWEMFGVFYGTKLFAKHFELLTKIYIRLFLHLQLLSHHKILGIFCVKT